MVAPTFGAWYGCPGCGFRGLYITSSGTESIRVISWKIPNALLKRGINRYKDEGSMNPIATWWDWGDWWQLLVSGSDSKQVSTSIFGVPMGPRSLGRDRWDLGPWDKKPSGRRHPAGVQSFSYSGTM